jgi:endonuclease/exonuclease/phosphatase family metal-dependent hydrolase
MSASMRILTYNTQLRSKLMEIGLPPSIPPVYTAPKRAEFIAKAITDSAEEIDVVCLNEIFDETARDILSTELAGAFPYQVAKADTFHTRIVSPGLSDDVLEKVWELTFGPVADVAGLAMLKAEDSGLFLASRFPFATVPTPPEVVALLGPSAFPNGVPRVRFLMYADAADNDKYAAKGVLYVGLQPPGQTPRHVFCSHTQADTKAVKQYASERRKQIEDIAWFVEKCVEQSPPLTEEVFVVGDLNVLGHPDSSGDDAEWRSLFEEATGPMSGPLIDRWRRDQCPGDGRTDLGHTAHAPYPPHRQRLDYVVTSATSKLAIQHLRIDHELADPHGALTYLSDHWPLRADVNAITPHCTPASALIVDAAKPGATDFDHQDQLSDGAVRWYRYDTPGTYDVRVKMADGGDVLVGFAIYLGDDFSTPQPTYRDIVDPDRGSRFVLAAPFFVKVYLLSRHQRGTYRLRTHRHDGRTLDDAIVLPAGRQLREHFPQGKFNDDTAAADWDVSNSKWFVLQTPRIPVPGTIELALAVDSVEQVTVTLGRWDGVGPPAKLIEQATPGHHPRLSWQATHDEHFVVLVQRHTLNKFHFLIEASTNMSVLVARVCKDAALVCEKETSGWGADDIALEIRADGAVVAALPNAMIGDFEQDAARDVGDKIPPLTPYLDGIEVKVIEEDDIDDNDVGVGTIPPVRDARRTPGFVADPGTGIDGKITGSLQIGVDDGRYGFSCVISPWHPAL